MRNDLEGGERTPTSTTTSDSASSQELEELIRAQRAEMHAGSFQSPERNVVHFGDVGINHDHDIFDVMDISKIVDLSMTYSDCPYHNKTYMVIRPNGRVECAECARQRCEAYRRRHGEKPRATCPHGARIKKECRQCKREWDKITAKNWYKTDKGRAYLKRKWAANAAKRTPEQRHREYLRRLERKGPDFINKERQESRARVRARKEANG